MMSWLKMTSPVTIKQEPGSDSMEQYRVTDMTDSHSFGDSATNSNNLDSQYLCRKIDDRFCPNSIPIIKNEQSIEQDTVGDIRSPMSPQNDIQTEQPMLDEQQIYNEVRSTQYDLIQTRTDSGIDNWLCFAEVIYKCKLCSSLPSYQTSLDGFFLHIKDEHLTGHVSFVECTSCTLRFRTAHDLRVHANAGAPHQLCNKSIITGSALAASVELDLKMKNSAKLRYNNDPTPRTISSPVSSNLPNAQVLNQVNNNSVAQDSMVSGNSEVTLGRANESLNHLKQLTDQIPTTVNQNFPCAMPNSSISPNVSFTPGFGFYTKIVRGGGSVFYFCQVCNYTSSMRQSFVQHCMGVNHQIKVHYAQNNTKATDAGPPPDCTGSSDTRPPVDCTSLSKKLSDNSTDLSIKGTNLTGFNFNSGTNSPSTTGTKTDHNGTGLERIELHQRLDRTSQDSEYEGNIENPLTNLVSDTLESMPLVTASNTMNQTQTNTSETCTGYTIDATNSPSSPPHLSGSSRRKRAPVRRLISDIVSDVSSLQEDPCMDTDQNDSGPLSKKMKIEPLSPIMPQQEETEENMEDSKELVQRNLSTSSMYGSCETLVASRSTVSDDLNSPAPLPIVSDAETYNIYARMSNNILNNQLYNNNGSNSDNNNNNNNINRDNADRFPHYNYNYLGSENKAMSKIVKTEGDVHVVMSKESVVDGSRSIMPLGDVQSVSQATCGEFFKCALCTYTYSNALHYQRHFETVHMSYNTAKRPNEGDYEAWKVTKIRDCLTDMVAMNSRGNVSRDLLLMKISIQTNDSSVIYWGPVCNRAVREQFPESVAQRKGKYKNSMMDCCCLCDGLEEPGRFLISLTSKGKRTLVLASEERRDGISEKIESSVNLKVHADCRKAYTHPSNIQKQKRMSENSSGPEEIDAKKPKLRAKDDLFNFKKHCLFCGENILYNSKTSAERHKIVREVETLGFLDIIKNRIRDRGDSWGDEVLTRIEHSYDLVAAEARYHECCRTKFFLTQDSFSSRGRPKDDDTSLAFEGLCEYMEDNDECQYSLDELLARMQESMDGQSTWSAKYMKKKLESHFGNRVIITCLKGRSNIVTFKDSSMRILQDTWYTNRDSDPEAERMRIVQKAAAIIREDIRAKVYNCDEYPLSSVLDCSELIPATLDSFLLTIIDSGRKKDKQQDVVKRRCSAIAQSIIGSCRPRSFISPVLLSIAVYIHRKYASKELIDILHSLMFCSSYREVQQYMNSIMQLEDCIPT